MKFKSILLLSSILTLTLLSCGQSNNTNNNNNDSSTSDSVTIKWLNYDGTVLETDSNVSNPIIPSYDGLEPFKPSDEEGFFTFDGWVLAEDKSNEKTYVATFTKNKYYFHNSGDDFGINADSWVYYQNARHIVVPNKVDDNIINYIRFDNNVGNYKLQKLELSNEITSLYLVLYDCYQLENIILPNKLEKLTNFIFDYDRCPNFKYNEYDTGLYIGSESNPHLVFIGNKNPGSKESLNINNNCKFIYFNKLDNITSITIPNSIKYIGRSYRSYDSLTINYNGTTLEWNEIEKDSYWKNYIKHIEIICTDGQIEYNN